MPKLKQHSVVQKSYQCEFCRVKCRRPQDLRRHLFVHTEASFQCDSCGNKFTRYDTLMRHKRDNCRHSQSAWTERHRKDHEPFVEHVAVVNTELCHNSSINAHSPTEQTSQYPSPIHITAMPEYIPVGPESPMAYSPCSYGAQPPYVHRPPPPLKQVGPHQQPPLHGIQRPDPIISPYTPQAWPPSPLGVTSPVPIEIVNPPTSGYPATSPSPKSMHSPIMIGQALQTPPSLRSPQQLCVSLNGGCAPSSPVYATSCAPPTTPPQEESRELPRIIEPNVTEFKMRRHNSLQPLEPNPSRFHSEPATRFPPMLPNAASSS